MIITWIGYAVTQEEKILTYIYMGVWVAYDIYMSGLFFQPGKVEERRTKYGFFGRLKKSTVERQKPLVSFDMVWYSEIWSRCTYAR